MFPLVLPNATSSDTCLFIHSIYQHLTIAQSWLHLQCLHITGFLVFLKNSSKCSCPVNKNSWMSLRNRLVLYISAYTQYNWSTMCAFFIRRFFLRCLAHHTWLQYCSTMEKVWNFLEKWKSAKNKLCLKYAKSCMLQRLY